jgi:transposase
MTKTTYATERLDHLGIVAGVCHEIGLIEQIDAYVGPTKRKVSVGEAVQAMVINALGFVGRPLYLTPEFFSNKPVDLLIRPGLAAEDLNDDSLGRALDALYAQGVTEVFGAVAAHALEVYGIAHRFYHLDSTTLSLHGEYQGDHEPEAITITHGYSRDHRPDLKQAVLSLICSYRSRLPVWLEALSGNEADRTSFPKTIQAYVDQLDAGETPYFIADSALYSAQNIQELSQVKWITRVPATLKAVQTLYEELDPAHMRPSTVEGYRVAELGSTYGGVRQRWLGVFSAAAYARETQRLQQQVAQEQQAANQTLQRLEKREFDAVAEAEQTIEELCESWAYHKLTYELESVPHYDHPGRPRQGEEPARWGWQIRKGTVIPDQEAIEQERQTKGKFILATNELRADVLSADKLLAAYKSQGAAVERGFRFLKDPLFFADSLFLKKPARIMALLMVMGLSLLVYALAERKLRTQLATHDEYIPDQKGQPTQRPTMRRIFQMFEGIDVLLISTATGTARRVVNLEPVHHKILKLLGSYVQKCYLVDI